MTATLAFMYLYKARYYGMDKNVSYIIKLYFIKDLLRILLITAVRMHYCNLC